MNADRPPVAPFDGFDCAILGSRAHRPSLARNVDCLVVETRNFEGLRSYDGRQFPGRRDHRLSFRVMVIAEHVRQVLINAASICNIQELRAETNT